MNKITFSEQGILAKLFRFLFWWTGDSDSQHPLRCDVALPIDICSMFWSIVFGVVIFPIASLLRVIGLLLMPILGKMPEKFQTFINRPLTRNEVIFTYIVCIVYSVVFILLNHWYHWYDMNIEGFLKFLYNFSIFMIVLTLALLLTGVVTFLIYLITIGFHGIFDSFVGRVIRDFKDKTCSMIEWKSAKEKEYPQVEAIMEVIHFPDMTVQEGQLHINENEQLSEIAKLWIAPEGVTITSIQKNMIATTNGIYFVVFEEEEDSNYYDFTKINL